MAYVTAHAVERYIQRIRPDLTADQAKAVIMGSARMIDLAASFGAHCVKMPCGARLMLQDDVVTTVKIAHTRQDNPASSAMFKRWRRRAKIAGKAPYSSETDLEGTW